MLKKARKCRTQKNWKAFTLHTQLLFYVLWSSQPVTLSSSIKWVNEFKNATLKRHSVEHIWYSSTAVKINYGFSQKSEIKRRNIKNMLEFEFFFLGFWASFYREVIDAAQNRNSPTRNRLRDVQVRIPNEKTAPQSYFLISCIHSN